MDERELQTWEAAVDDRQLEEALELLLEGDTEGAEMLLHDYIVREG